MTRSRIVAFGACCILAAPLSLVACGGDGGGGTDPVLVDAVNVGPANPSVQVGQSVQLSATPVDDSGDPLPRAVTWTSLNEAVATVSASGLVAGVAPGSASIRATSEGVNGSVTVTVTALPGAVVIDSITPAVILDGGTATIHGSGFASTVAGNAVMVDSSAATVTAATATTLQITLPTACRPARDAKFSVTVGGSTSGDFAHAVRPTSFVDMEIGEQVILRSPDALCLQFQQGADSATYVIGVQSTTATGSSLTPARLSAIAGAGAPAAPAVVFQPSVSASRAAATAPSTPRSRRLERHRDAEMGLRARERNLVDQLVASRVARASAPSLSASRMAVPPDAAVGDTVSIRVVDPTVTGSQLCTTFSTVNAVVRVIGTSGIWLTDVENPAGGYSDADLQALSDMFDDQIYATDVDYLGTPTDMDGNGRVAILTTRRVNEADGLLGFVFSGDLFPAGGCAASNEGEIYYGIAPDPDGVFGGAYTLADARLDAPALIAHEFAHILQNANAAHSRDVWESEGQATFIEEVVGFAAQGRAPGNDYGFAVAANLPEVDSIDWYYGHIYGLFTYYGFPGTTTGAQIAGAPEQCSWLVRPPNGPCLNAGRLVYDVPKSLLRYISDQFGPSHPQGEQGVHRDLLASEASGFDAIEEVTGLPIETVLARWAASLYVDGRYAGMDPTLQVTTWNMFAIASGFIENTKLTPRARSFATFTDDFRVRGGSTAYFTVKGANRPAVAIGVGSQSGAALPAFMQVWVVRVQ